MSLFKSSSGKRGESRLSLLQGLLILGVIGIAATVLFKYLAGQL